MKKTILIHTMSRFNMKSILKKNILILFICSISFWSMANPPMASKQQMGMFINSKTCIVLEGSLTYDAYIRDAIGKYWTSTEFEFIDKQEFEKRRYDTKYSFLVIMKGTFENDPGGISYNYLCLVMGYPVNDVTKMPEICSIPVSYADDSNVDYGYAIPSIVKFMQKHAKNLMNKKRSRISFQGLKFYNCSALFKDKAMLFNKDLMSPDANTEQKIKNTYPYYFKLLTTSEIEKELSANPSNTLFNFHVGPTQSSGAGRCFEMIFDGSGNLYYYHCRKVTNDNKDGFNRKDLKHIR
jgi:hypothetical protein